MQAGIRPKVGLLGLTLELYETLSSGLRQGREEWVRRQVIPALAPWAEVSFPGAAWRRQDVERIVGDFEAAGTDALLVMHLTYSPSQIALPALRGTRLPILLWNTQELWAADQGMTGQDMSRNHGVHGTQDLANVLLRSGVRFAYVTSHLRDPAGLEELKDFFAAAAAVSRLRRARVGLLGYPFPGMGDFAVDTTHMTATLGCQIQMLPLQEYIDRAAAAPDGEVAELAHRYWEDYDVKAVEPEELEATARAELALRAMASERGLDALTYQFLAFGEDKRTVTLPFVAASRMMAEGIGFGGEGDVIAAAGTALLNWLQPPATFSEVFTMDFGGNGLVMSHMGECNVAMARRDRKVPLVARGSKIAPTRQRQLALAVSLEPGPATLFALTLGPEQRWRIIASAVEVADWGPLAAMQVPHFKLLPQGDVRDFLTRYALAGGPHHNAVCFGDARARLRYVAQMLGADYCEV